MLLAMRGSNASWCFRTTSSRPGPDSRAGSATRSSNIQCTIEAILESSVRDVSGDGRKDLILRLLIIEGNHSRELLYVYGAPEGSSHLRRIFAQELAYTEGANGITNRATFEPNGGGIRVTLNNATGYTAANHPPATDPTHCRHSRRGAPIAWSSIGGATRRIRSNRRAPNRTAAIDREHRRRR